MLPVLDLGPVAIELRVEHRMRAETIGPAFEECRPATAADRRTDAPCRGFDGDDIHAVDDFGGNIVALRLDVDVGLRLRALEPGAHGVEVVLADKQHRQPPQLGQIEALVELALGDRTFAKETGGNAVALLHLLGHRQADGERQSAADNSVAAIEAGGSVEQMHRPAAPVAAAFGFAIHLGHDRIHRHAAGESMAVLAIGRDHRVGWRQRLHRTDGDRLLADVEMHEPADLLLLIKLGAFLLEAPDAHHRAEQRSKCSRVRCGFPGSVPCARGDGR